MAPLRTPTPRDVGARLRSSRRGSFSTRSKASASIRTSPGGCSDTVQSPSTAQVVAETRSRASLNRLISAKPCSISPRQLGAVASAPTRPPIPQPTPPARAVVLEPQGGLSWFMPTPIPGVLSPLEVSGRYHWSGHGWDRASALRFDLGRLNDRGFVNRRPVYGVQFAQCIDLSLGQGMTPSTAPVGETAPRGSSSMPARGSGSSSTESGSRRSSSQSQRAPERPVA